MREWFLEYQLIGEGVNNSQQDLFVLSPEAATLASRLVIAVIVHSPAEIQGWCMLELRGLIARLRWDGTMSGVLSFLADLTDASRSITPGIAREFKVDPEQPGMQLRASLAGLAIDRKGEIIAFRRGDIAVGSQASVLLPAEVDERTITLSWQLLKQTFPGHPLTEADCVHEFAGDADVWVRSRQSPRNRSEPCISIRAYPTQ